MNWFLKKANKIKSYEMNKGVEKKKFFILSWHSLEVSKSEKVQK